MTTEIEFFTQQVIISRSPVMVFIDGENLAIRYGNMRGNRSSIASHVTYEADIFVWSDSLNYLCGHANVIRKYYYTSAVGDDPRLNSLVDQLKEAGIEAPRVFKRPKTRSSKQVDIALATDMLSHGHRKNYEIAVLVAGDQDYVPLVESVQAQGRRVFLWFVDDGLSADLRRRSDRYNDIGEILFGPGLR